MAWRGLGSPAAGARRSKSRTKPPRKTAPTRRPLADGAWRFRPFLATFRRCVSSGRKVDGQYPHLTLKGEHCHPRLMADFFQHSRLPPLHHLADSDLAAREAELAAW